MHNERNIVAMIRNVRKQKNEKSNFSRQSHKCSRHFPRYHYLFCIALAMGFHSSLYRLTPLVCQQRLERRRNEFVDCRFLCFHHFGFVVSEICKRCLTFNVFRLHERVQRVFDILCSFLWWLHIHLEIRMPHDVAVQRRSHSRNG